MEGSETIALEFLILWMDVLEMMKFNSTISLFVQNSKFATQQPKIKLLSIEYMNLARMT